MKRWPRKLKTKQERRDTEQVRREVFEREGGHCQMCQKYCPFEGDVFERGHAAHIISKARGGPFIPENLRWLCADDHIGHEHGYGPSGQKPCPKK